MTKAIKAIKVITILAVIFFMSSIANAQFSGGGGIPGGIGGGGIPPAGVPFDGGLSLILLAAGAGLAKRKKTSPPSKGERDSA